ncbi:hypothetical protein O6H91_22G042000 [Diphasiastrum complanatum]|uniref:Uncharacterized protein n=9 Tax=Diphasiastrum complanatum TaxID=34168 RepID=A0ACC2AER2_DIPCM|nr:hypothetical protein O6H91_22G042000 [Diphasiastrum complanatum]KAJ7516076.1 hypothetical protein O6H91_22G042000 [Diphasiastrum complanatum]KAJ7516077.1 hypothetical protein O6H91_22G042000 [Diphasiastrum complanatum]KAJ7516078.1 hypothetical protein O6H91_22G042000 [Diphasiastrum complanatum]KAJ7516080.1 hypothetical protein O6H91_22G042000 [Diphasiastrum complanatum]
MNLSLLDPFQSDFPEVIEEYLEHGVTRCISFNRRGTLLAAGCSDGACVIWDFDTRGVAKELRDKSCTSAVTSVSWSKCGHRLVSAAMDRSLSLWDVAHGVKIKSVSLQQTALLARLHPGTAVPTLCLACPMSSAPILVDLQSGEKHALPIVLCSKPTDLGHTGRGKFNDSTPHYSPCAASFNKRGDLIYVGNSKGEILIIDTDSRQIRSCFQVPGGATIRQIHFSRSGQYILTNSTDRVIRVFENLLPREGAAAKLAESSSVSVESNGAGGLKLASMPCLCLTKDFQDAVNRVQWKVACFNGDGECVVGASATKGEHKIHIWNRKFGQLAKILEGPKESIIDLAWHPTRPIVASVCLSGLVYLWAKNYTENWSAFAPDFRELEENEEYVEKEDEFDLMPEVDKVKPVQVDEDVEVDILTTEKVAAYSDSDDSQEGLYFLPTIPLSDSPVREQSPQPSVTPVSPERAQSSNPSGSNGSPASDEGLPPDSSACQLENFPAVGTAITEEEIGPNGRIKRKRRLSEKAVEFQAEIGRKYSQKGRIPVPKKKTDPKTSTPISTRAGIGEDGEEETPNGRSSLKQESNERRVVNNEGFSLKKTEKRVQRLKPVSLLTSNQV